MVPAPAVSHHHPRDGQTLERLTDRKNKGGYKPGGICSVKVVSRVTNFHSSCNIKKNPQKGRKRLECGSADTHREKDTEGGTY